VKGAVFAAVSRALDDELAVLLLDPDVADDPLQELAHRSLDPHQVGLDRDVHAVGQRDGLFSDPAHQTLATSSPPTPARRASCPVMTPWEVDTIAVPMPPKIRGTSPAFT